MLDRPAHLASRLGCEPATIWRYSGGGRNQHGEWDRGLAVQSSIAVTSAPDDGRARALAGRWQPS